MGNHSRVIHMTDDDRVEFLAQALWKGTMATGLVILPEWTAYVQANPQSAIGLREQAAKMIGLASSVNGHHGLHWLWTVTDAPAPINVVPAPIVVSAGGV